VSSCFIESWLVDWAKAAIEAAKIQASVKLLNIFFMVFLLGGEYRIRSSGRIEPAG
jgi:hypothetical protein